MQASIRGPQDRSHVMIKLTHREAAELSGALHRSAGLLRQRAETMDLRGGEAGKVAARNARETADEHDDMAQTIAAIYGRKVLTAA